MRTQYAIRRLLCGILAAAVLVQPALAATGTLPDEVLPGDVITAADVGLDDLTPITLRTSEAGIALIKSLEGFTATAHWDYSQYSIGYGTACEEDEYPDGITEAQADRLLREVLAVYETSLDAFLRKNNITLTTQQYDALMSFTYNNGAGWMATTCKLVQCLRRGTYSDEELMNALGPWCHINSSTVLATLARRRIVEAQVFLTGNYENKATDFYYVIFDANGGQLSGSQEDILYFSYGSSLDTLDLFYLDIDQTAVKEGATFQGWRTAAYKQLTDRSAVTVNMTVYAMWDENTAKEVLPAASTLPGWSQGFTETTEQETVTTPTTTTTTTPTATTITFTDVQATDWYHDAVTYVAAQGLFNGTSATQFSPETAMTRAMFVKVLANLSGVDLSGYQTSKFSDVKTTDWYCAAVTWAAEKGLVTGYSDGTFAPEAEITREQMCVILTRYAAAAGVSLPKTTAAVTFPDSTAISSYAREAVAACQQAGLISGRSSGVFDPQGTAMRCEVAKVMMGFHKLLS
jgi:GH24 family phage-related lysozyme (muramidase)